MDPWLKRISKQKTNNDEINEECDKIQLLEVESNTRIIDDLKNYN